ncbi:LCP family protein [Actinomadura parmotrematis]|nr:LCP family protein [Actinomadura parmotrematis]
MEYVDDADPQPPRRRGWRILGWVSVGLSAVMVAGSLTAYGFYRDAMGNIGHQNLDDVGPDRPKKLNSALNILMIGSDTRAGANASYGRSMKNEAPRSDTMILLHLSPGGTQAMGISFPRDLMVPIPSCKTGTGYSAATNRGQINSAFTTGGAKYGALCVVKTIEKMSDIHIDHFMQVDFTGFKSITTAVGGVPVCLPKDVDDKDSKLHLSKGRHVIKGETALAYVRNRHGLGDGSDTQRIKRQQQFMGALANKVLSAGTLSNPTKLFKLVQAGTQSLTTDTQLNATGIMSIAKGMSGISSGKLRFVTVPSGPDPLDPNRVALTSAAQPFFQTIRNDKTVQTETKQAAPKIPASQVRVRVYNSSGISGRAGRVAQDLEAQGFQVEVAGNAPNSATTKVMFGSGADQQAVTLAQALKNAPAPAARAKGVAGTVDLFIGADYEGLRAKSGIPTQQGEIRASDDICKKTT